jgi:hypothetical protein
MTIPPTQSERCERQPSDAFFRPVRVPNQYPDWLLRWAVLNGIFPKCRNNPNSIPRFTVSLVQLWRNRLNELAALGWYPGPATDHAVAAQTLQYARNCNPTFAVCVPKTRVCGHDNLCPFCYARRLQDIYETVNTFFVTHAPGADAAPYTNHLLARFHRVHVPFSRSEGHRQAAQMASQRRRRHTDLVPSLDISGPARDYLSCLLTTAIRKRALWIRELNAVGAIALTTVVPTTRCWRFEQRQLFVLRPDQGIAGLAEKTDGWVERFERPTPRKLVDVLARLYRYPTQLLRCEAQHLQIVLQAQRGKRMFAKFGCFRNQSDNSQYREGENG